MADELVFRFTDQEWHLGRTALVMGILNVTPDSFSDAGCYFKQDDAVEKALLMAEQGAHIIDVGGESTRPGAVPVSAEEEVERVVPVIRAVSSKISLPVSVDTSKAAVAEAAIEAGAQIINDVSGLQRDLDIIGVLKRSHAGCILMHMRGTPRTMQQCTNYEDLLSDICTFFRNTMEAAEKNGISRDHFILDPGIGFAKTAEQNLELIAHLREFRKLNRPILAGPSRKSFIGRLIPGSDSSSRVWGTAGAVACCVFCGADIVRVHDVAEMQQVVTVAAAIRQAAALDKTA